MRPGSGRLILSKIGLMSKGEIKIRLNNEKRLPCLQVTLLFHFQDKKNSKALRHCCTLLSGIRTIFP